jgi:hypothetical protein
MILSALVLVALSASPSAAQNVLGNPGFETAPPTPNNPVGNWATFASAQGAATHSTAMPHGGTGHMDLSTAGMDQFAGVFQDIDVPIAGRSVTFSGWHKAQTNPVGSVQEIKFEWTGATHDIIREIVPTANYTQFSLTRTAPAGATDLRVTYAIATFGPGLGDSTVFIDDISVTVIPEPAAASLLGIAGLGMLRFRRRK